jgi:hypothetical protein
VSAAAQTDGVVATTAAQAGGAAAQAEQEFGPAAPELVELRVLVLRSLESTLMLLDLENLQDHVPRLRLREPNCWAQQE